jgi:hypothetical protein
MCIYIYPIMYPMIFPIIRSQNMYPHCSSTSPVLSQNLAVSCQEAIDPKNASLPVQWKNELEPPTVAQAQRDEQDAKCAAMGGAEDGNATGNGRHGTTMG